MKENKRKINSLISILLIIVLVTISLMYFNIKGKDVAIKSSLKEYNLELEENEHMHLEEDSTGDKIPVPNGYVGSKVAGENEIDTGYVIYEGEVNDENVVKAQKTRNQYVWIPVPDISKMYGIDENGKKWGKLYEFTTDEGDNIDPITGAKPLNWSENNGIMNIIGIYNYREPDIVLKDNSMKVYDMNSNLKNLNIGAENSHNFLIQLEKEFNEMIDSVRKYGGFYIGRYETGNLNQEKAVIIKGNINISSQNWYTMYKKCKDLKDENMNIETGMIWGNQWDRTLMWLIESDNKSKEEICKDSSSWGNYISATFEYEETDGNIVTKNEGIAKRIPTGSTEYTNANNIYDLAGNAHEWTMEGEATSTMNRIFRGGYFSYSSTSVLPSSNRGGYVTTSTNVYRSCRAMLYIK